MFFQDSFSFMVTCQSSELGWEVTVELPTDFLSLGRGSVIFRQESRKIQDGQIEQHLLLPPFEIKSTEFLWFFSW